MPNEIRTALPDADPVDITITLGTLADGAGRASAAIANASERGSALISIRIRSGSVAPTVNNQYSIYLLRGDSEATTPLRTDGWTGADEAFTQLNATFIGAVTVTADTNTDFFKDIDTEPAGKLGEEWGIAVVNESGQALNATDGDHIIRYRYHLPEVQ